MIEAYALIIGTPMSNSGREVIKSPSFIVLKSWHKARNNPPATEWPFMTQNVGQLRVRTFWNTSKDWVTDVNMFVLLADQSFKSKPVEKNFLPVPIVTNTHY